MTQLMKQQQQLAEKNKEVLRQIVLAVEFLANQSLPFRGHCDDKVDFSCDDTNRGNFVATLQFLAKENNILQKHVFHAKKNAKYTSKTIQNWTIHIYATKIRENLTKDL